MNTIKLAKVLEFEVQLEAFFLVQSAFWTNNFNYPSVSKICLAIKVVLSLDTARFTKNLLRKIRFNVDVIDNHSSRGILLQRHKFLLKPFLEEMQCWGIEWSVEEAQLPTCIWVILIRDKRPITSGELRYFICYLTSSCVHTHGKNSSVVIESPSNCWHEQVSKRISSKVVSNCERGALV